MLRVDSLYGSFETKIDAEKTKAGTEEKETSIFEITSEKDASLSELIDAFDKLAEKEFEDSSSSIVKFFTGMLGILKDLLGEEKTDIKKDTTKDSAGAGRLQGYGNPHSDPSCVVTNTVYNDEVKTEILKDTPEVQEISYTYPDGTVAIATTKYSSNGNPVSYTNINKETGAIITEGRCSVNENGDYVNEFTHYDAFGNIASKEYVTGSQNGVKSELYTFGGDEKMHLSSVTYSNTQRNDGIWNRDTVIQYDEKGNIETKQQYNMDGSLNAIMHYDKDGKLESISHYNRNGKLCDASYYDKEGNWLSGSSGETRGGSVTRYDENGLKQVYSKDGKPITIENEDGTRIEYRYRPDHSLETTRTYDANGNIIEEIVNYKKGVKTTVFENNQKTISTIVNTNEKTTSIVLEQRTSLYAPPLYGKANSKVIVKNTDGDIIATYRYNSEGYLIK